MLLAEAQFADDVAVSLDIVPVEVSQVPSSAAYQLEQTTLRVVVVRVLAHVPGQLIDSLGQYRDLNLGRASIALGTGVLGNDRGFLFGCNHSVIGR